MKKIIVISVICLALFSIVLLLLKNNSAADPRGDLYAGAEKCMKCHSDVHGSYVHTAHYAASATAGGNTVHGSFSDNLNVFILGPSQKVVMEKRSDGMYQTYYKNGKIIESRRFDIVMGGVKGESYLYWKGNTLNQLPVSYYSKQHEWALSPRFDPRYVNFNRSINSRCLQCHASYIGDRPADEQKFNSTEEFDKSTLVMPVDCERCHGPGAMHVEFQTDHPEIKTAKYMVSYASLPRARRIDMCAVCHSGNNSEMLRSTFGFKPGDNYADFKLPDFKYRIDTSRLDVHGNQVQLLQSSKCFIYSKMDCATCHDVHQNQRGNTLLFNQKCLGCHSGTKHNYCKMANASNARLIGSNCIKCHMPELTTQAIITPNADKTFSADIFVHTHHIAVYPGETKKILLMIGK
jgi:hypothetical protein